jgi:hypothetical protein
MHYPTIGISVQGMGVFINRFVGLFSVHVLGRVDDCSGDTLIEVKP